LQFLGKEFCETFCPIFFKLDLKIDSTFKFIFELLSCFTSGLNFINILEAAFMRADPERTKKIDNLTVFFALSGSTRVKAAYRMLMKLTPDEKFSS